MILIKIFSVGEFLNSSFHILQAFVSSPCCVVLFVTLCLVYTIDDLMLFGYCASNLFLHLL